MSVFNIQEYLLHDWRLLFRLSQLWLEWWPVKITRPTCKQQKIYERRFNWFLENGPFSQFAPQYDLCCFNVDLASDPTMKGTPSHFGRIDDMNSQQKPANPILESVWVLTWYTGAPAWHNWHSVRNMGREIQTVSYQIYHLQLEKLAVRPATHS